MPRVEGAKEPRWRGCVTAGARMCSACADFLRGVCSVVHSRAKTKRAKACSDVPAPKPVATVDSVVNGPAHDDKRHALCPLYIVDMHEDRARCPHCSTGYSSQHRKESRHGKGVETIIVEGEPFNIQQRLRSKFTPSGGFSNVGAVPVRLMHYPVSHVALLCLQYDRSLRFLYVSSERIKMLEKQAGSLLDDLAKAEAEKDRGAGMRLLELMDAPSRKLHQLKKDLEKAQVCVGLAAIVGHNQRSVCVP